MSSKELVVIKNNENGSINMGSKQRESGLKKFLIETSKDLASYVPGVSSLVKLHENYTIYTEHNEINRLTTFFYGLGADKAEAFITALGPEYAEQIIDCVMKDIESDKLKYYQNLVVNINNEDYSKEQRQAFASILRSLTCQDIELARRYYINSNYELNDLGYTVEQLYCLSNTEDGLELRSIENLRANGLLYESKVNRTLPYEYNVTTNTLNSLIELIYLENELKPESIGASYDSRESVDVFIFNAFHTKANREKYEMGLNEGADEKIRKYQENLLHITKLLNENDITFKIGDNYSFQKLRNNAKTYMFIDGDVNEFFSGDEIYKDLSVKKLIITMSGSVRLDFFNDDDTKYILYAKNDENDTKLITTLHELIDGQ